METIKVQELEVGSQVRILRPTNKLFNVTIAVVGYDGLYYYVTRQSVSIGMNFIQQITYGGFENYNKKNTGLYKAYRFKTKKSVQNKINSFL